MDDLTVPRIVRRREGFPGQHHCVVPHEVAARAARHPLLRGLLPTDAGLYPAAIGHFVDRPQGAPGTVLIACCQGRGWVRRRGMETVIEPGDVAVLAPDEPHAYGSDDEQPWTIEWVHFSGAEAAGWRTQLLQDQNGCVVRLPLPVIAEVNLAKVHEHLEAGYGDVQLLRAAVALRASLTEIVGLRPMRGALPSALAAIDASAAWMRANLDRRITLTDLAARACLSPSHYSDVFRRRFGFAPIDWLLRQRVHRGCSLLQTRPDKVAVLARMVGVGDAFYFSRLFRRVMGVSPQEFRRATQWGGSDRGAVRSRGRPSKKPDSGASS